MEQESGSLFQPGCRGDKPKERQRQDDEAERWKPEQVDREPEGRAPEGIQHEGEGGELCGDGTAEGQPEKPDETAHGGTHGRDPALQGFERREGERAVVPELAEPRGTKRDARHRRKRELHAQIVKAQGIGQNHAEQGEQEHVGKGEGRAQVPAEAFGKQIGHAAQQANDGEHQGGPHQ